MLTAQRRNELRQILLARKSITVSEMAKFFKVSTETIRRDFDALANEGFLDKSYGGATLKTRVTYQASQQVKSGIMLENKQRMAKKAASFIHPNDCIFLDHSTTVYEICKEIDDLPLTIMTNSLYVLYYFSRNPIIKLACPGGHFDTNTQGFFGLELLDYLSRHYLDKAFFSCRSLDIESGLCDATEQSAALRRKIIAQSGAAYLLADQSKFDKRAFIHVADIDSLECIITDNTLSDKWSSFLNNKDVRFIEAL